MALIVNLGLLWGRRRFDQQLDRFLSCLPPVPGVMHVLTADRAFGSSRFLQVVAKRNGAGVVRLKGNFVVYDPPPPRPQGQQGRPAHYGRASRVDQLPLHQMQKTVSRRKIGERLYKVTSWRGTFLRRGVGPVEILAVR